MQPPLDSRITFTQPSQGVWRVWLDGNRVGTVYGDEGIGFTARDIEFHSLGRGYDSVEAAIQACVPIGSQV